MTLGNDVITLGYVYSNTLKKPKTMPFLILKRQKPFEHAQCKNFSNVYSYIASVLLVITVRLFSERSKISPQTSGRIKEL